MANLLTIHEVKTYQQPSTPKKALGAVAGAATFGATALALAATTLFPVWVVDSFVASKHATTNKPANNGQQNAVFKFLDKNLNKTAKFIDKNKFAKPLKFAFLIPLGCALLKTKKITDEQSKNKFDKTTTYIKNNAGKLAALCTVPYILDGISNALFSNKKLPLKITSGAYCATIMGIIGLSTYIAGKVKDSIAKPKEIKRQTFLA